MKNEEITIPRAWFERLNGIYESMKDESKAERQLHVLLGYLASVETILKLNKKA